TACNRKGTVTFTAESQRSVRRSVLHKDGCVDCLSVFCNVVNVLGMDVRGMAVAVLKPYSLLNSVVKILRSYNAENRHHKLRRDQRMFLRSFEYDAADVCRCIDSDHGKKCSRVASNTFTVQFAALKHYGSQ